MNIHMSCTVFVLADVHVYIQYSRYMHVNNTYVYTRVHTVYKTVCLLQLQQELWAVDIDIGMTTCQSMYFLLVHITRGSFSWSEGTYNIMNSHNQPEVCMYVRM